MQNIKIVKRTFLFMKPMHIRYFAGSALSSFELIILFALPEINRMLIQMITQDEGMNAIRNITFIMLGLLLLTPFIVLGRYWQIKCAQKLSDNLVRALFNHTLQLPMHYLGKLKTGDYLLRLTGDVYNASDMFRSAPIVYFVRFLVVTCVTFTILFSIDWRVALLCALYNIVCFIVSMCANPAVAKLDNEARNEISFSTSVVLETMRALPVVRIFLMTHALGERYRMHCQNVYKKRKSFRTVSGIAYGAVDFFTFSAQVFAFLFAILLLTRSEMPLDIVVYVATLTALSANAMLQLSAFTLSMQPCLVAAKRIFSMLDESTEDYELAEIESPDKNALEVLRLRNISFTYPDGTSALNKINLVVNTGENIAIVGESGGGKTTLLQIIASLIKPSSGEIHYFGANNVSLAHIRTLIAYVPQEPVLFDGTIYENVSMGRPDAASKEILKAANDAGLDIDLDTMVGERGSQLSGGQRQRVVIARAFLKDAPILLLDEATGALDSETEIQVQQNLAALSHGRTTITIAHRLSTIKNAERILVIENGAIVEEGTHDALMAMRGIYAKYNSRYN